MYANLENFHNTIKALVLRIIKNSNLTIENQYIQRQIIVNKIIIKINQLNIDNVISDIIDMILYEGDMTLQELINDINFYINYHSTIIYKKVYDKQSIIEFLKVRNTNGQILTEHVIRLFAWSKTIKGANFYAQLHTKIGPKLSCVNIYLLVNKTINNYLNL